MNFQFDMQEILNPNHELTQDQIHSLRNEFNQKVQYSKVTQFKEPKTIRFSDDIEINIQELHQFSIFSHQSFNEDIHSFPIEFDKGLVA